MWKLYKLTMLVLVVVVTMCANGTAACPQQDSPHGVIRNPLEGIVYMRRFRPAGNSGIVRMRNYVPYRSVDSSQENATNIKIAAAACAETIELQSSQIDEESTQPQSVKFERQTSSKRQSPRRATDALQREHTRREYFAPVTPCPPEQHYLSDLDALFSCSRKWIGTSSARHLAQRETLQLTTRSSNSLDESSIVSQIQTVSSQNTLAPTAFSDQWPSNNDSSVDSDLHQLFPSVQLLTADSAPSLNRIYPSALGNNSGDSATEEASRLLESRGISTVYLNSAGTIRGRPTRTPCRIYHRPLYFEDPNLERCGHGCGYFTNVKSAAVMAAQTVMLPYKLTADRPSDRVVSLPDCPTCHKFGRDAYVPRWSWKAAAVQAGVVTGMIYIIP